MLQFWFFVNSLLWPFGVEVGGFKLGLNVVAIVLVGVLFFIKNRLSGFGRTAIAIFFMYTFISVIVVHFSPCTDKFVKSLVTAPIFFFILVVGLEIGWRASEEDWLKLQHRCPWLLLAVYIGFVAEFLGLLAGKGRYESYSGIYFEPSHVAFSLFPSIAILLLAQSKQLRRVGVLALLGLLIFSRSSTLILFTIVWVFYQAFVQKKLTKGLIIWAVVLPAGFFVLGEVGSSALAPFIERVLGVAGGGDAVENISSLVYLQGWQDVWANLIRTNGLGLGFNMMGCTPLPEVDAREILAKLFEIELNSEDGSFIFSKFVSETGVFGILLICVIVWWFIRLIKEIRKLPFDAKNDVIFIQTGLIFLFIFTMVERGGGYFNAAMLLWVVAISASVKWYKGSRRRIAGKFTTLAINAKQKRRFIRVVRARWYGGL